LQRLLFCSLPLLLLVYLVLVYLVIGNYVGPGLGRYAVELLGHTAITFLLLTLALSSGVRIWWASSWLRYRRMLGPGLFCSFYASLHVLSFVAFHPGMVAQIWFEIQERPYIAVGMMAFVPLTLLVLSSNHWSMRRLRRNWKRLHRLVYLILGTVMYWLRRCSC
jgi:sulfoxide reductase heme-binding subunit YedZ